MKTIYKYALETMDAQRLTMRAGAEILCIQVQRGCPMIWASVDPQASFEQRTFRTYGTGFKIPDNPGRYIGTYQLDGGDFVWHVFEETGEQNG